MKDFIYLTCPFTTLILCQLIKFVTESWMAGTLKWGRLFNGSGGMPSSHTSFTFSLTALIGLKMGFETPIFALSLVFSIIVGYDAMGLRRESGKQAAAINQIFDEVFSKDSESGMFHLKEQVGHKPLEVFMGALLGISMALLFSHI